MIKYFQWPKSKAKKTLFIYSVLSFIWASSMIVNVSFHQESDLKSADKLCGIVSQYDYIEIASRGGGGAWRLKIYKQGSKTKTFEVGLRYLHHPLQSNKVKKGDKICIKYIPATPLIMSSKPFVTQITIDSKAILDSNLVLINYMKKPSKFHRYICFVAFILAIICVIKFKNEKRSI